MRWVAVRDERGGAEDPRKVGVFAYKHTHIMHTITQLRLAYPL
jgi:hypothetical protein